MIAPQAQAEMEAALLTDGIRMAAHDLLQHVQLARGYLEMMPPSALRDKALTATVRTGEYIGQLQDLAHIHEHRLELNREPTDLLDVVNTVAQRSQAWPERRGSHIVRVVASSHPTGEWDRTRLLQIVSHILSNALLYSPEGGEIVLDVSTAGDQALLTVRDSGIGLTDEEITRAFTWFTRGPNAHRYGYGRGLGLYFAQQLALLHGGGIGIESRPDVGTTVTVMLPLL